MELVNGIFIIMINTIKKLKGKSEFWQRVGNENKIKKKGNSRNESTITDTKNSMNGFDNRLDTV